MRVITRDIESSSFETELIMYTIHRRILCDLTDGLANGQIDESKADRWSCGSERGRRQTWPSQSALNGTLGSTQYSYLHKAIALALNEIRYRGRVITPRPAGGITQILLLPTSLAIVIFASKANTHQHEKVSPT